MRLRPRSGVAAWIADDVAPALAGEQRVGGEGLRPERRLGHADQAGVLLRRRLGVDREDHPLLRQGVRHHHAVARGGEVVEDHLLDRIGAGDEAEDRALRVALAVEREEGAAEEQAVAGRAADHRQVAERRVDGGDDDLLAAAEPVDHQEAEARPAGRGAEAGREVPQVAHPVEGHVLAQVAQPERLGVERGGGEGDRHHPAVLVAAEGEAARRRAAEDAAGGAEGLAQPAGQRREDRPLGGEDEDERRRGRPERRGDLGRGGALAAGDGDGPRRRQPGLEEVVGRGHGQRLKTRALLARSAACVRLRTLILDMIAAMWVFTVASAIESS
jgi:hypothetical protein